MQRYGANIVFIQETHIAQNTNFKLYSKTYPTWYYGDSSTSRVKGVTIVFSNEVRFVLEVRLADPEGRYLFLKGKLQEMECTLANVYCPNRGP